MIFKENYRWEIYFCIQGYILQHLSDMHSFCWCPYCSEPWHVHFPNTARACYGFDKNTKAAFVPAAALWGRKDDAVGSALLGLSQQHSSDESLWKYPTFTDIMLNSRRFTLHGNNLSSINCTCLNPWQIKS